MNYTENYHLPQWAKSDRIMMEDFNGAMSSIENGLTRLERRKTAFDNLSRDAYRQEVRQRVHHGSGGGLDAMWVNALSSLEEVGSGHAWGGGYGIGLGKGKRPTKEGVLATAKEISYIKWAPTYVEYSLTAAAEFTSDGFGSIETITCWFGKNTTFTSKDFPFVLTFTRADTNAIVAQTELLSDITNGSKAYTVNFPVEENVRYRVEFHLPDKSTFYGFGGFYINSEMNRDKLLEMTFTDRPKSDTLVKSVSRPADYQKAKGIIRWAGDGSAKLRINGQELPVLRTKDAINAKGELCKETELELAELPEGDLTVELTAQVNTGPFRVYDYGLIWQ